jgi:hypothetical protein
MGWRQKMKSETLTRNPINPKNLHGEEVSSVSSVNSRGSKNEKPGYPIPTTEAEFAKDERQAIIDVGGGQDSGPVEYPVEVKIESAILGAAVDVMLWPDHATVDGVEYSKQELADLLSRGISAADLQTVHRVKHDFEGEVIQS